MTLFEFLELSEVEIEMLMSAMHTAQEAKNEIAKKVAQDLEDGIPGLSDQEF